MSTCICIVNVTKCTLKIFQGIVIYMIPKLQVNFSHVAFHLNITDLEPWYLAYLGFGIVLFLSAESWSQ